MSPLSAYLQPSTPLASAAPETASSSQQSASAWFSGDAGDAGRVLRAPHSAADADAGRLTQRFLDCLCGEAN